MPRMRGADMRWFGLAFLPVACGVMLLLAYLDHAVEAYFAMYPLVIFGTIVLVISCRKPKKFSPTACRRCGYSLASNTSGVCPECGERI